VSEREERKRRGRGVKRQRKGDMASTTSLLLVNQEEVFK